MKNPFGLPPQTLPADVWDALELSTLVNGGISAQWHGTKDTFNGVGCLYAHAVFLDGPHLGDALAARAPVHAALKATGIGCLDKVIMSIPEDQRLSWAEFAARANLTRGDV